MEWQAVDWFMKTYLAKLLFCFFLAIVSAGAHAQGTFVNRNFESANLVNPPAPAFPTLVAFNDAFPGWTGYAGTNQLTQAWNNGVSGGAALITLVTPNTATGGGYFGSSNSVISGTFTAVLAAGIGSSGAVSVSLAQNGLFPADAQSLLFSLGDLSVINDLSISFNGQQLPFYVLSGGPNYNVYGADISAFAGQSGELRFTANPFTTPFSKAYLDDIFFSNQPIPEPSALSLLAAGALLLCWRLRRT